MPAAYARHDAILRQAVTTHGGTVYKVVGDAIQAVFPTAPAAAAAALAAQRELSSEAWPACGLPQPLRVRMALHAGSAEPDASGNYRAPMLFRLERLLAAAHGGQVLLTTTMYGLAWDALPKDAALRDLGEQRLKDLEQPSHVFQLLHPALEAEFPPLRTLERHPTNLPFPPTTFFGRETEIDAIAALLRRGQARLVTLTGPGGIGKTRLALSAARRLLDDFPDGVWFVELAAIVDAELVAEAIATALRVRVSGGAAALTPLRGALEDKRALLVLDNFEQVVAAAALTNELLLACPEVKVLVTSRVPLHLRAEQEYPVAPLSLPRRQPPPTLEQVTQYEAVRLFIERAQAVRPDFEVSNASAPAVAEICHLLDGLPLAIELAAARARLLDPESMLTRLEKRLSLLTGGPRDMPERQRTLRQTLAWSYDLLPPQEQALFRRLAVFAGGFTLEAAEAVSVDSSGLDALEGVERLVEQSLLRQATGEAGPRFGMLETIREFGLEQISLHSDEDAAARRAHATYYAELITRSRHITSIGDPSGIGEMIAERDNVRAMLHYLLETGETETALRVTMRLSDHWTFTGGQFKDGRTHLEHALADGAAANPVTRAYALYGLAMIATHQGDHKAARAAATEALALARAAGDPGATVGALFWLSSGYAFGGQIDEAIAHIQEATRIARDAQNADWLVWTLWFHGMARIVTGELDESRASLEEGLALSRRLGDPWGEAATLMVLALAAGDQGDLGLSASHHAASLRCYSALGAGIGVPYSFVGLAHVAMQSGLAEAAAWLLGAGEGHFDRFGYRSPPGLSRRANRVETAIRDRLGNEAAAQFMSHGRALTTHDAINEAVTFADGLAAGAEEPLSA